MSVVPEARNDAAAAPIQRVGFVGIGNMGWPMAANLVRAGFDVTAVDAAAGRAAAFAAEVGGSAADAEDAAAEADAMVTMLPTSDHVADVIARTRARLRPGTLVIEMSSGVPSVTQALAGDLAAHGVGLVDCPVSGGVARASTGELAIMAGGAAGNCAVPSACWRPSARPYTTAAASARARR